MDVFTFTMQYKALNFEMDLQLNIPCEGKDNFGTVSRMREMWNMSYNRGKWDSERYE